MFIQVFLFALCFFSSASQSCLNHQQKPVDWFVQLHMPRSVSSGYLYLDSISQEFRIYGESPDSQGTPLFNTITTLNNRENYDVIAWNDKVPNGPTSSTRAHSKHFTIYDKTTQDGAFFVHSMPSYPKVQEKTVDPKIQDSQRMFGQHLLCMTVKGNTLRELLSKSNSIRPNVYANTNTDNFTVQPAPNTFEYVYFKLGETSVRSIFKNGGRNASIFEDGLNMMLLSDIMAETWGRPLMSHWCVDPYRVGNVGGLNIADGINWTQNQDHSKWAVATKQGTDFVCFGDLNRMVSQFRRGGAFYCLQHPYMKIFLILSFREPSACKQTSE